VRQRGAYSRIASSETLRHRVLRSGEAARGVHRENETMTRDKDRKRIIRNRMKTTGEAYTTARGHVLARASKARPRPATASPPAVDHAAIAGKSDDTMKRQTGHTWTEWVRLLDGEAASTLTHRDVAQLVHDKYGISGWWSQTVTVGYERLKGLREVGQRRGGAYE
jgi:hypothetical protein